MSQRRAGRRPPLSARLEGWLARRSRWVLIALLGASFLARAGVFLELSGSPALHWHRWDQTDLHFFDRWARNIAAGDWIGEDPLHPHLGWHRAIARNFANRYPERTREILGQEGAGAMQASGDPPAPEGADPSVVLWDFWYGGRRFHQEPLYPYALALTYAVFGPDPRWVFAWQLATGVLGTALIFLITKRYFGATAATAAGLLAVLSAPLILYDFALLRASLIATAGLALVYVLDRALRRDTTLSWLATGAALGLALLLKTTFGLFAAGAFVLLGVRHYRAPGTLARHAGAMALGLAVALAPLVARNVAVGVPPLALSSVGGLAFITSNTDDFPPGEGFFLGSRHLLEVLHASDARLLPSVTATLATHDGPTSWPALLWGKFLRVWHWYEKPNNLDFYYFRLHSSLLRWLPATFLVVAPLGLAGALLAARRRREAAPLYLLLLNALVPLVLFYVLSRFRAPLLAALIPFAGLTVASLVAWVSERRWIPVTVTAAGLLAIGLWSGSRPLPGGEELIRAVDYKVGYDVYYIPRIEEAAERAAGDGNRERVSEIIADSLRVEPPFVKELAAGQPVRSRYEAQVASLFADARSHLAEALRAQGRRERADEEERTVDAIRRSVQRFIGDRR